MNRYSRRLLCAIAVIAVLIVATGGATRATADTASDERAAELKLFKVINRARDAQGLRLLKEHDEIHTEAKAHSERMANQQTLSHIGFDARAARIANADSGIDPNEVCENVGSAGIARVERAMKGLFRAWKQSQTHADCMFDALGYTTRSGAVGVIFSEGTWWVTFIAARDDSR